MLIVSLDLWAADNKKVISELISQGKSAATFQQYKKAETFYRQAYKHKSPYAAYLLATHFVNGYGRDVNIDQAIHWYEKAYELGYNRACYELGIMYYHYKRDIAKAQGYFEKSITFGEVDAYHDLAILYINKKNYEKAKELLNNPRVSTHQPSQYTLAQLYLYALGLEQNTNKAVDLLVKAANSNFEPAISQLGNIYVSGQFVPMNLEKAEVWFEKSYRLFKKNGIKLAGVLIEQNKDIQAKELLEYLEKEGNATASEMLKKITNG